MNALPAGTRFIGLDGRTRYEVTMPAADHEDGWVEVRDLSMTDAEAQQLLTTPGAVQPGCDPRDQVFLTGQVEADVEVIP